MDAEGELRSETAPLNDRKATNQDKIGTKQLDLHSLLKAIKSSSSEEVTA